MQQIFQKSALNRQFERDGYVSLDVLDSNQTNLIADFYRSESEVDSSGFHNTLESGSAERKRRIYHFLQEFFDRCLSDHFCEYRSLSGTFVTKEPDAGSIVLPHQDWTFVDESVHKSLNIWIPLCDTNEMNGRLGFVRGSHRLKGAVRGSNIPKRINSRKPLESYVEFLDNRAGEVLVYDHRLIHCSGINRSKTGRTAASIGIIPKGAAALHYLGDKSRPTRVLEVQIDERFYWNYLLDTEKLKDPTINLDVNIGGYPFRELDFQMMPVNVDDRERRPPVAEMLNILRRKVKSNRA